MTYEFSVFRADTAAGTVHRGADAIHLTPIEFRVLSVLLAKDARLVSNEEFYVAVWKQSPDVGKDALRQHIRSLRRKLGADLIVNVPNEGYMLAAEVLLAGRVETVGLSSPVPLELAPSEASLVALPSIIDEQPVPKSAAPPRPMQPRRLRRWLPTLAVALLLAIVIISYWLGAARREPSPVPNYVQITDDGNPKAGPLWNDGKRVWFTEDLGSEGCIASVAAGGGSITREKIPGASGDFYFRALLAARGPGPEFLLHMQGPVGASDVWHWTPGRMPRALALNFASSATWTAAREDAFAAAKVDGVVFYDRRQSLA